MSYLPIPPAYKNPINILKKLSQKPESYWIHNGEKRALDLFHLMARDVPAYKDFLKINNCNPKNIRTIADFKQIPPVSKDNYLRKYRLEDLCWNGKLDDKRWTIAATSGSTGEPFYFPRENDQDEQYAITAEIYMRNNFAIQKKSTLYINGFGMGVWIGGVFTYEAVKQLAERGLYKLSIITPGSSKNEIINAVKNLGDKFDQIIIGGYPPLVKDTVDEGLRVGLNWKKYAIKFVFSAEGFSESFRDYIAEKVGLKNIYTDSLNHYGTVDLGTMAHETPACIAIRRMASENTKLNNALFGHDHKIPTLTQYNPELFFFEEVNDRLYCSSYSGLPLVRYDLKDTGGVVTFAHLKEIFASQGKDVEKELQDRGISSTWNLPFVYVFERSDFTVKLSGANIYPEEIRKALLDASVSDFLTGKFTMIIKFDAKQDQYLEVNVELKPDVKISPTLEKQVEQLIIQYLLQTNSEYSYLYNNLPRQRLVPKIIFHPYEDPNYFSGKGKQTWTKKTI